MTLASARWWARTALVATAAASGAGGGAAIPGPVEGQSSGALKITVAGIRSDDGQVRVAVFAARERWLKKPAYAKVLDIENRQCEWLLEVPYGEYAIAVFHDTNGNGRTDRNFLGTPSEPYGFSNNARATFGAPGWEKAKFSVASPMQEVAVSVK